MDKTNGNEELVKRWIELSQSLCDMLDAWATAERRSSKQQTELIIEQAVKAHVMEIQKVTRK